MSDDTCPSYLPELCGQRGGHPYIPHGTEIPVPHDSSADTTSTAVLGPPPTLPVDTTLVGLIPPETVTTSTVALTAPPVPPDGLPNTGALSGAVLAWAVIFTIVGAAMRHITRRQS